MKGAASPKTGTKKNGGGSVKKNAPGNIIKAKAKLQQLNNPNEIISLGTMDIEAPNNSQIKNQIVSMVSRANIQLSKTPVDGPVNLGLVPTPKY